MKQIKNLLIFFLLCISEGICAQQTVTQVFSDFNGWWTSSVGKVSTIAPDNSHSLVGFQVGDKVYSTGVNNALLRDHSISYVSLLFKSLPVNTVGNSGIIGVGRAYDKPVENNPVLYLTDGINGLDLCTAMFNWSGSNTYNIASVSPAAIGDGIPDILIPQVGDPSPSYDKFRFVDSLGAIVGVERSVMFTGIAAVGSNEWKFYSRANPPVLGAASAGKRELRIIAYDYSDLGITTDNYKRISKFVHQLSGTSDQPFIAYNYSSFVVVPVTLKDFSAVKSRNDVKLKWTTANEFNIRSFSVERSTDGLSWSTIGAIKSQVPGGNSFDDLEYNFEDLNPYIGWNYYRLAQADVDDRITYSNVVKIDFSKPNSVTVNLFPNPVRNILEVKGLPMGCSIIISNMHGTKMYETTSGINTKIDVSGLPNGVYVVKTIRQNGEDAGSYKFIKE